MNADEPRTSEPRVFARPPEHLVGKDPTDFTPEDEAEFDSWFDKVYGAMTTNSSADARSETT